MHVIRVIGLFGAEVDENWDRIIEDDGREEEAAEVLVCAGGWKEEVKLRLRSSLEGR